MAGRPFFIPALTNDSGAPVSGAKLFSKIPGTSTDRPVYTDETLSTPVANPFVLDAGGRGVVYLDVLKAYDLSIKSADEATTYAEVYEPPHPDSAGGIVPIILANNAAMTALTSADYLVDNGVYRTLGKTSERDGGEGVWVYDSASTTTANGGTILAIDGGGAGRFFRLIEGSVWEAAWFGCVVSLTDQSTAINNAIAACGAAGGGTVRLPRVVGDNRIGIASTINLGDGSTSQVSTYHNVVLEGVGAEGAINLDFDGPRAGTTLVWVGAAAGRMADLRGPVRGCALRSVILDGGGTASYGYRLASASFGRFENVGVYRVRERLREFSVVEITDATLDTANWGYAVKSPSDNVFIGCEFDGHTGVTTYAAICDYYDGWDNPASSTDFDPVRNTSINTKYIVNLNDNAGLGRAGIGIYMGFCDSNSWIDTWMQGLGTPASPTTAHAIYLKGVSISGANYPVNNSFTGKLQLGQSLRITRDASVASPGGNLFLPPQEVDQEYRPTWPETLGITGLHPEAVDSDTEINYVSEYGLQRIRDNRRQQLLNSSFLRATRGTSFTDPAALAMTLDMWSRDKDGTVSDVISRQNFAAGQTDVPFEPKHYMRTAISAASGATAYYHFQRMESVERFSGRNCVFSFWAKVSSSTMAVTATVTQNFGSGGSPSTSATTNADTRDQNQTVTTTWQRFSFRFSVPSISGKTLGSTANTSYTQINIGLPANTVVTFDMAEPQFEYGACDTPWDRLPWQEEDALCARYLRTVQRTLNRIYNDFGVIATANVLDSIVKYPGMRAAPSLVVSGSASDYQVRDYAGANGGNCDSSPTLVQIGDEAGILRFTSTGHGLSAGTLGRQESNLTGLLLLSAEL